MSIRKKQQSIGLTLSWPSKIEAWFNNTDQDFINLANSGLYVQSWVLGPVTGMASSSPTIRVLIVATSSAGALRVGVGVLTLALYLSTMAVDSVSSGPSGW